MSAIKGTVNRVELIGWLGDTPKEKRTSHDVAIANFSVATKRPGMKQEDGSWLYETEWVDVEAFDHLAETIISNLKKGSRVRVTGTLRSQTWEDRNGTKHRTTVVRAEEIMFLDARSSVDEGNMMDAN